jgi:hypothetical protein
MWHHCFFLLLYLNLSHCCVYFKGSLNWCFLSMLKIIQQALLLSTSVFESFSSLCIFQRFFKLMLFEHIKDHTAGFASFYLCIWIFLIGAVRRQTWDQCDCFFLLLYLNLFHCCAEAFCAYCRFNSSVVNRLRRSDFNNTSRISFALGHPFRSCIRKHDILWLLLSTSVFESLSLLCIFQWFFKLMPFDITEGLPLIGAEGGAEKVT